MRLLSSKPLTLPRLAAIALSFLLLGLLVWAALAPVSSGSGEELFEIPPGTSERRLSGEDLEILPQTIRLGVNDVLVLRNADVAPHIFGPTLIMPGQTFRLPFTQAATYSFLCTAHADGQLEVIVEPIAPAGWERLRLRWRNLTEVT